MKKIKKLKFPCKYPIKVIGHNVDGLDAFVVETFNKHTPVPFEGQLVNKLSQEGKYISFTIFITANSEEQLKALHEDLKKNSSIIMVL